jgi:hypothetical protein
MYVLDLQGTLGTPSTHTRLSRARVRARASPSSSAASDVTFASTTAAPQFAASLEFSAVSAEFRVASSVFAATSFSFRAASAPSAAACLRRCSTPLLVPRRGALSEGSRC